LLRLLPLLHPIARGSKLRDGPEARTMARRGIVQTTLWLIVVGAILFAAGGDWYWPQGWIFLGGSAVSTFAFCFWLARYDPALLKSRMSLRFHPDQGLWDRVFLTSAGLGFVGWLALAALDAHRFRWSHTPIWAQGLGAVLVALCMVLMWRVFRANSFAAPQVRIQAERGQVAVTAGPYRVIRHPMYAAAIFYFIGVPLLLGSCWALLPVPFFIAAFGVRAIGEERVLRQSLAGYNAYADKVRFRFVPGVW
jgi:protein-S-isoprenylcysteine O-methyltransferase Ste14